MSQKSKRIHVNPSVSLMVGLTFLLFNPITSNTFSQDKADSSIVGQLTAEAKGLKSLVTSEVAGQFLEAVQYLPDSTPTAVGYYNRAKREIITEADYLARPESLRAGFEKKEYNEQFYYYTGYGSPLAFVRALDLAGRNGLSHFNKGAIYDFGFGSIGQLELMARLGGSVTGFEVSPVLQYIYKGSTGPKGRLIGIVDDGMMGSVELMYGNFPADPAIANALQERDGKGSVFFSKNTLKRGYVHPEKAVDPRMLVNLGVTDSAFVKRVYDLLGPGGLFVIYNISPKYTPPTDSNYIPWSDGRCPFDQSLLEKTGFKVISYNTDDTEFVHTMGEPLGWFQKPEDKASYFGMYTIVKKP